MKVNHEGSPVFRTEIILTDEEREILCKASEIAQTLYDTIEGQACQIDDETGREVHIDYQIHYLPNASAEWIDDMASSLDLLGNDVGIIVIEPEEE